jgi:LacI family transcriptional regulator
MASSLRSQQNDTLALVIPDIATTFWTAMARGAEDEAWEHGYSIFICNTDDDREKEEHYINTLVRRRVAGIAIVATLGSADLLRRLQARQQPFVMLHRKIGDIDADVIRSDSRSGAVALTERLLAAGRRRLAYVGGPLAGSLGQDRLAGYREALARVGIEPDPALIKIGVHSQQSGYELMSELLRARPLPEAILIGNARLALGALHALAKAGLRVPEDLQIATFFEISSLIDDTRLIRTPLTIATQQSYEIGRLGIRRLLERIAGKHDAAEDILLPVEIAVRAGWFSDTPE